MFQYSLTNLGGVNDWRRAALAVLMMFQYSLTNLGGVNKKAQLALRVVEKVSVFSNESWWGEPRFARASLFLPMRCFSIL